MKTDAGRSGPEAALESRTLPSAGCLHKPGYVPGAGQSAVCLPNPALPASLTP